MQSIGECQCAPHLWRVSHIYAPSKDRTSEVNTRIYEPSGDRHSRHSSTERPRSAALERGDHSEEEEEEEKERGLQQVALAHLRNLLTPFAREGGVYFSHDILRSSRLTAGSLSPLIPPFNFTIFSLIYGPV